MMLFFSCRIVLRRLSMAPEADAETPAVRSRKLIWEDPFAFMACRVLKATATRSAAAAAPPAGHDQRGQASS